MDKLIKKLKGSGGITVPDDLQSEADAEAYKSSSLVGKVKHLNPPV